MGRRAPTCATATRRCALRAPPIRAARRAASGPEDRDGLRSSPKTVLLFGIADRHHAPDRCDARVEPAGWIAGDVHQRRDAIHHLPLPDEAAEKENNVVVGTMFLQQRQGVAGEIGGRDALDRRIVHDAHHSLPVAMRSTMSASMVWRTVKGRREGSPPSLAISGASASALSRTPLVEKDQPDERRPRARHDDLLAIALTEEQMLDGRTAAGPDS